MANLRDKSSDKMRWIPLSKLGLSFKFRWIGTIQPTITLTDGLKTKTTHGKLGKLENPGNSAENRFQNARENA